MLGQALTAVLLLSAVMGAGLAAASTLGPRLTLNVPATASLIPLSGLTFVGVVTLVVGHVGALGPWLPYFLGGAGVLAAASRYRAMVALIRQTTRGAWSQARGYPVPVTTLAVALLMAVAAATAPPSRTDEVEYHWSAPLAWAQAGAWNDSPYRHVDGFPFMEVIYTAAAVQNGYIAAHLLQLVSLVGLGLATAGAAKSLGVRGTGAVAAAAMLMPVAWDGAYVAYNDTAGGAYAAAAVAVVLGARGRLTATLVAAALLCSAVSIKPTAVVAVGMVGLVQLMRERFDHPTWRSALRASVPHWLVLGIIAGLTLAFWSLRQWVFTGHLIDPTLEAQPSADALTRLPSQTQRFLAPLLPLVSGIIGSHEPWGGRTSLVVQILLYPALVYAYVHRRDVGRRFATLALPAWVHWSVLGVANVRTRFHIVTWVLLVGSVRVALEDAAARHPRSARWLEWVWSLGVVLSAIDVGIEMVRLITS